MGKDKYSYGTFGPKHLEVIQKGLALYNVQKFWECHEELEDHWIEDPGDQARLVYWAVIQAASSCYHYRNENLVGALGLLKKTLKKLEKMEIGGVETDLVYQHLDWKNFKGLIRQIPLDNTSLHDFKKLFNFKFPILKTGSQ